MRTQEISELAEMLSFIEQKFVMLMSMMPSGSDSTMTEIHKFEEIATKGIHDFLKMNRLGYLRVLQDSRIEINWAEIYDTLLEKPSLYNHKGFMRHVRNNIVKKYSENHWRLIKTLSTIRQFGETYSLTQIIGRSFSQHESEKMFVDMFQAAKSDKSHEYLENIEYLPIHTKIFQKQTVSTELLISFCEELAAANNISLDTDFYDKKVFIVHGHDSSAKYELKGLLISFGLTPIILHELPNMGSSSIIEKFENNAKSIDLAIVLLTPDDIGYRKQSRNKKQRARQNVLFELGYFFGLLGRGKVICVHKKDLEIPSDINGVMYYPFENHLPTEIGQHLKLELEALGIIS